MEFNYFHSSNGVSKKLDIGTSKRVWYNFFLHILEMKIIRSWSMHVFQQTKSWRSCFWLQFQFVTILTWKYRNVNTAIQVLIYLSVWLALKVFAQNLSIKLLHICTQTRSYTHPFSMENVKCHMCEWMGLKRTLIIECIWNHNCKSIEWTVFVKWIGFPYDIFRSHEIDPAM